MRWDIDKALAKLEPDSLKGTSLKRCLLPPGSLNRWGLKPRAKDDQRDVISVWVLAIGFLGRRQAEFAGYTIHQAYMKAYRAWQAGQLADEDLNGKLALVPPAKNPEKVRANREARKKLKKRKAAQKAQKEKS